MHCAVLQWVRLFGPLQHVSWTHNSTSVQLTWVDKAWTTKHIQMHMHTCAQPPKIATA